MNARSKKPRRTQRTLSFESLETRRLLSVTPGVNLTVGETLRTYRVAFATTQEATVALGGTAQAQNFVSNLVQAVSRNFERELSVRLELIPNNSLLISGTTGDDNYSNANLGQLISENTGVINSKLNGDSNNGAGYDIGHVLGTSGGGLADLGVVGKRNKGAGASAIGTSPVSTVEQITWLVTHEMGHQFGADHVLNGQSGTCGGAREAANAYEPGSGSTFLGYLGNCNSDDLSTLTGQAQPFDAGQSFHAASFDQILRFLTTDRDAQQAGSPIATGNQLPTFTASPTNFTIPANTPFVLTAAATDADANDRLTYSWEQIDPAANREQLVGSIPLTVNGQPATAAHSLNELDQTAAQYVVGDQILITGQDSNGNSVNGAYTFNAAHTLADLLRSAPLPNGGFPGDTSIGTTFPLSSEAFIDETGRIRLVAGAARDAQLSLNLSTADSSPTTGNTGFGTFSVAIEGTDDPGAVAVPIAVAADVTGPLFRSFLPTSEPSRTFPRLEDILANTSQSTNKDEHLPTNPRELNFRVTVRDNHPFPGGGGIASGVVSQDVRLQVAASSGFMVTFNNNGADITGGSSQTISWDRAGTDASPINTTSVDILLSADGGQTYPIVLAAATSNDGSEQVVFPNIDVAQARLKIQATPSQNIFFDVNDANFRVTQDASAPGIVIEPTNGTTRIAEGNLQSTSFPATDTYTIRLTQAATSDVDVTISADPQTQVSTDGSTFASSQVVRFTQGTTAAQTVTVRAVNDSVLESQHTALIRHAVTASNDSNYSPAVLNQSTLGQIPVDIIDDEGAPLIGVDFDVDPQFGTPTPPTNWTSFPSVFSSATRSNLPREDGDTSNVGLEVTVSPTASPPSGVSVVTTSTLPRHTPGIKNVEGVQTWTSSNTVTANWSGLNPDRQYRVYVFLVENFGDSADQRITITGTGTDNPAPFVQDSSATAGGTLLINDSTGTESNFLEGFAKTVTSTSNGAITVRIEPNSGNNVFLSGLAVQEVVTQPIQVSIADVSTAEGDSDTTFAFTVSLDKPSSQNVTVLVNTADGTATVADNDYTALPTDQLVTISAGDTSATVNVTVRGDTKSEVNETFTVALRDPRIGGLTSAAALIIADAIGQATITNDDSTSLAIAAASAVQAEGNATTAFTFTVTRSGDTSGTTTVDYAVTGSGSNAAVASDFVGNALPSGQVSFAANETSQTITVNVAGDTTVEPDEGFTVTLSGPSGGATLSTATANGTITNDDSTSLAIAAASAVQAEGNATTAFTFTVTRSGDTSGTTTVDYAVTGSGSNAAVASDFVGNALPSGQVSFAANETSQTITVNVAGDTTVEPDEGFTVTLSGPSGGATLSTATANGTITNDDSTSLAIAAASAVQAEGNATTAFTFTVTRSGDTSGTTTVDYAVTGSGSNAAVASDFVGNALPSGQVSFAANETSQTITVNVAGDTTVEPDEGFTVTLSGPSGGATLSTATANGTITNDDSTSLAIAAASAVQAEGNATTAFTFTVTRSGDTSGTTTVDYAVTGSGSNAAVASDFVGNALPSGQVSFAANETSQTITVNVAGDTTVEPDEGFTVTLSGPSGGATLSTATANGTITNDDSTSLAIAAASAVQAEGNATTAFTFTVTRSGDTSGTTTVDYAVTGSGSNAAVASDFVGNALPSGQVSFAANETSQTITVNVAGDTTVEPDEGFTVTLSGPSGGATLSTATANGTITNDDSTSLAIAAASAVQAEGNATTAFTFTVTRSGDTSGTTTVDYAVTGSGSNAAVASDFVGNALPSGQVSFAANETSQTITVNVAGDTTVEPDEGFTVTLSGPSGGATLSTATANGTITNDDSTSPIVSLTVSTSAVLEDSAATLTYTFTRSGPTTTTLPVSFRLGGTAAAATDYQISGAATLTATSGVVNISPGDTSGSVVVSPMADSEVEPDESVTLTLLPGSGYSVGTVSAVTSTISNDDASGTSIGCEVAHTSGSLARASDAAVFDFALSQGPTNGVYRVKVFGTNGNLIPATPVVLDSTGAPVQVSSRAVGATGAQPMSSVTAELSPGQYRIQVGSDQNTTGDFRVAVCLLGSLTGGQQVQSHELLQAEAAIMQHIFGMNHVAQELLGQRLGGAVTTDAFRPEFDSNLNGVMDITDFQAVVKNYSQSGSPSVVAALTPASGNAANPEGEDVVLHNASLPADVDNDRLVTARDALLVVNKFQELSMDDGRAGGAEGEASRSFFYDVSGDALITPIDVLLVVNTLESGNDFAEGEATRGETRDEPSALSARSIAGVPAVGLPVHHVRPNTGRLARAGIGHSSLPRHLEDEDDLVELLAADPARRLASR